MITPRPPEEFDRKHWITAAWSLGARGQGIHVAVLDEALDPEDPHLAGSVEEVIDFQDGARPTPDSHGTNVARLIRMWAPECRITGISIFPGNASMPTAGYNRSVRDAATKAVRFCLEQRPAIRIINMSFDVPRGRFLGFGGCSPARRCRLCTAVNDAKARGVLPVAAAGNRGPREDTSECPACAEGAMTVGAVLSRAEQQAYEQAKGPARRNFGTSWSAAYVSGAMAALMSAGPGCSLAEVQDAYIAGCSTIAGGTTLGRVNLVVALSHLVGMEQASVDVCLERVAAATASDWPATLAGKGRVHDAILMLLVHIQRAPLRLGELGLAAELMARLDKLVPWVEVHAGLARRAEAIRGQLRPDQ